MEAKKKLGLKNLVSDKRFWFASFLIAWAAALQGHMMWVQRQESFKQKFGTTAAQDDTTTDQNQGGGTITTIDSE